MQIVTVWTVLPVHSWTKASLLGLSRCKRGKDGTALVTPVNLINEPAEFLFCHESHETITHFTGRFFHHRTIPYQSTTSRASAFRILCIKFSLMALQKWRSQWGGQAKSRWYRARNYYLSWVAWNWVINLLFVHPYEAGERNFFNPVSHNPGPVVGRKLEF